MLGFENNEDEENYRKLNQKSCNSLKPNGDNPQNIDKKIMVWCGLGGAWGDLEAILAPGLRKWPKHVEMM